VGKCCLAAALLLSPPTFAPWVGSLTLPASLADSAAHTSPQQAAPNGQEFLHRVRAHAILTAGDFLITEVTLTKCDNVHESNPLGQSVRSRIVVSVVVSIAVAGLEELAKHIAGKRGARVFRYGSAAPRVVAMSRNAWLIARCH